MTNFLHFLNANKALLTSLLALALSELLPFIKNTEANGLLHGLLSLLQSKQPPTA